jgi:saccharopine dehydrogenase-like NADP-dependent oxidoreductase
MVSKGIVDGPGVIPPEKLGMNETLANALLEELKRRGVRVEESIL